MDGNRKPYARYGWMFGRLVFTTAYITRVLCMLWYTPYTYGNDLSPERDFRSCTKGPKFSSLICVKIFCFRDVLSIDWNLAGSQFLAYFFIRNIPDYSLPEWLTRKLCYRKDDRTMRPTYECPENFRDSLTTPTATIPNIFMGFFRSTLWIFLQNLKSVALPVPGIIGNPWIRPRSLFSKILMGFYSDRPCKYTRQIWSP